MKEHQINQVGWDTIAKQWAQRPRAMANWEACRKRKDGYLTEIETKYLEDISGKRICVLASGDNLLVFRYAKLGAKLTSVDISQEMLDIAATRAALLGLDIVFIQADVIDLHSITDGGFDIVYIGGHATLWIAQLNRFISEAARILKPEGILMINEYHPFRYLWRDIPNKFELAHDYFSTGPFAVERAEGVPSFNYHWTISDYVEAILKARLDLIALKELGTDTHPDEVPPIEGLPRQLVLVGKKPHR